MTTENVSLYSVLIGITTTVIGASIASLLGAITYIQWQDHQVTVENSLRLKVVIERVDGVIRRLDGMVPTISEKEALTQHTSMMILINENKVRLNEIEKRLDRLEGSK